MDDLEIFEVTYPLENQPEWLYHVIYRIYGMKRKSDFISHIRRGSLVTLVFKARRRRTIYNVLPPIERSKPVKEYPKIDFVAQVSFFLEQLIERDRFGYDNIYCFEDFAVCTPDQLTRLIRELSFEIIDRALKVNADTYYIGIKNIPLVYQLSILHGQLSLVDLDSTARLDMKLGFIGCDGSIFDSSFQRWKSEADASQPIFPPTIV